MNQILFNIVILHFIESLVIIGFSLTILFKNRKKRKNLIGWYILSIILILAGVSTSYDILMDYTKKDYVVSKDNYDRIYNSKAPLTSELWTRKTRDLEIPDQLIKKTAFLDKPNKELKNRSIRITYTKRSLIVLKIEELKK